MPIADSREFLDFLLEGNEISESDFDAFVAAHPKEDQWFDYKAGLLTRPDRLSEGKKTIRQWVSGFANADGGTLIVGVDEQSPRQVSPCCNVGESLDVWASKLLQDMAGSFSPPARFQYFKHSKGDVLLVAVARAPQLVPCWEQRQLKYFLRVNDSTFEVPPYLISDLVLGRRNHPILQLSPRRPVLNVEAAGRPNARTTVIGFNLDMVIENHSLVSAKNVDVGLVGWTLRESGHTANPYILGFVDAGEPPRIGPSTLVWSLRHISWRDEHQPIGLIPRFHTRDLREWRIADLPRNNDYTYRCAVYVMPEGSPPTWFQLSLDTNKGTWTVPDSRFEPNSYSLKRVVVGRPALSCEPVA